MEIGYAQFGGVGEDFNSQLNSLREKTNLLFKNKFYGEDLYEIHVGIICVSSEYEQFFKIRRPKYQKEQKVYMKEGVKYTLYKNFEYDLKLDHNLYRSLSGDDLQKKLISEILNSFEILKTPLIKKKIKDFDRDLFLSDLETLKL